MKKSRFSDEQIIGMIKEHGTHLLRCAGSMASFQKYKSKLGGQHASGARKLKSLEAESEA
ncbi:MAG: hypothetical protein AB8B85_16625 [Paracoccaceae bacterium]